MRNNICPYDDCDGEIDVAPGTFDGEEYECYACGRLCFLAVGEDNSWWLYIDEED